jgi:hypothetical protein
LKERMAEMDDLEGNTSSGSMLVFPPLSPPLSSKNKDVGVGKNKANEKEETKWLSSSGSTFILQR